MARWLALLALAAALPALAQPAPPAERTIAAKTTAAEDRAIEQRLAQIFAELEGAKRIRVEARGGVVALRGEVLTPRVRERTVALAKKVEGVVEVRDETELVRALGEQGSRAGRRGAAQARLRRRRLPAAAARFAGWYSCCFAPPPGGLRAGTGSTAG